MLTLGGALVNRIFRFLKKDKSYIAYRLKQEIIYRLNKYRYRFPNLLVSQKNNPQFRFFSARSADEVINSNSVIAMANNICDQKFDLLGSGLITLDPLNWSMDFKTNFIWRKKYCHDYSYNDLDLSNDVKVPWELSRLQFLPTLAQAYIQTKNEKYFEKIIWYLEDWNSNNPFAYSINWACTMDVALRTISIILTIDLLKANGVDVRKFEKFNLLLEQHGLFISENLEKSDINGNHYLADLVGLYFSGLYFNNTNWKKTALAELEKEIENQLLSDGSDFEGSVPYHRLVLELFFLAYTVDFKNDKLFSEKYSTKILQMFIFVSRYIKQDGSAPIVGDNDNGRAFILGQEDLNDHRYILEIGQSLFSASKILSFPVLTDYCSWLGINKPIPSKDFSEEWASDNYAVIKKNGDYLFLEMSPIGLGGRGGHGHSDTGSFELIVNGICVFVDSGCHSYTSDYKRRNAFRSSAAHNIIQLDNDELFPLIEEKNLWNLINTVSQRVISLNNGELTLSHDGYGCFYNRSFKQIQDHHWEITDFIEGFSNKKSKLFSRFHLHPDCSYNQISDNEILIAQKGKNFKFTVKKSAKFSLNIEPCEISFHFGKLLNSSLIKVSASLVGLDSFELEYELKEVECSKPS
jgi:hypothetical protein